jgi:hypothetical protein
VTILTDFGPAELIADNGATLIVHFSLADYRAGKLTIAMSGPGRTMVLPKESVTDGRERNQS